MFVNMCLGFVCSDNHPPPASSNLSEILGCEKKKIKECCWCTFESSESVSWRVGFVTVNWF